jgi:transmembrane sensor
VVDEIYNIIGKRLANQNLTKEEQSSFDKWLSNEANQKEFTETERIWKDSLKLKKEISTDVDAEWKRFLVLKEEDGSKKGKSRKLLYYSVSIAASIILLFTIGFIFKNTSEKIIIVESKASVMELSLPDNSKVILNKNSVLKYSKSFGEKDRNTELQGEAMFMVEKMNIPFIVATNSGIEAKVLGTKFNIIDNKELIELNVIEGLVEFGNRIDNQLVKVAKNEKAEFNLAESKIEKMDIGVNDFAWYSHKLVFNNTPMHEVISTLEEYYNTQISIPESISNQGFTGKFNNQEIQEVADVIAVSFQLEFVIESSGLIFR